MLLHTEVLVIGAGPSGIGVGVQLIRQYGLRNFQIIEKSNDVGGTWFVNTYPGCGCDVSISEAFFGYCVTDFRVLGPFAFLFIFFRFKAGLVSSLCHAARDPGVLQISRRSI